MRIILEGSIISMADRGKNLLKDNIKLRLVEKYGYRMVMVGKMWRPYMAGSGKLFERFLGSWASISHRRACSTLTESSQELRSSPCPTSCRVTLAKTLQRASYEEAEGR